MVASANALRGFAGIDCVLLGAQIVILKYKAFLSNGQVTGTAYRHAAHLSVPTARARWARGPWCNMSASDRRALACPLSVADV